MALLYIESFDHQATADFFKKWTTPALGGGGAIVAGAGRCGSSALHFSAIGGAIKGVTVTGTASKGWCGFAYHGVATFVGTEFFRVYAGSAVNWSARWELSGAISVRNGYGGTMARSSAADVLRAGAYAYVEFGWTISATVGTITIRVNNVEVLAATGLHTTLVLPAPATTWDAVAVVNDNNSEAYVDDLYIADDTDDGLLPATSTFFGDVRVERLRPTADGASSGWTVTGGGTHANAVDKDADSTLTTPAITSATVGTRDTNAYGDPSVTTGACFGVQISALAVKDAAGPTTIGAVVRHSGTDSVQTAQSPPQTTPQYLVTTLQRNPVTAGAWTLAQVAAAEFGVERVS